jgi:PKD repeat protein
MKLPYLTLSLFILICLSIAPAMAYTLLSTTSVSNSGNPAPAYAQLIINTSSDWTQVTHLEATLDIAATSDQTYSNVCIKQDNTYAQVGTGTFSYSGTSFTADVTFTTSPTHQDLVWATTGSCNSMGFPLTDLTIRTPPSPTNNYASQPYGFALVYPGGGYEGKGTYRAYGGTAVVAPASSFSCTPTSQYPDTSVVCTDSSTNTPTDWLWSIDMEGAGIEGWQTHTGQNFTWQSHYPGLYSVNLRANNSAGSDWENKTNYVSISVNATPNNCNIPPVTGYIRTYAQTNDGMTSGGIYGSQIQMRDMEGGAWSNTTSSEGYWCIDTLPGHSLNLYAQATGYTSTSQLGVSANGGRYYLVLWPDYIPAASAGNVSLYVLVYDQQTGSPLYLSSVRVDGNNINTFLKNTGPEGQAVFTVKNQTSIHVTASKAGYNTVTRTMTTSNTGPDTLMISLPRSTVTVAPTQTTGPGGTVPTTIGPYGTPGPGGTMAPGYTNNQGQLMMDFLARNGLSLVELCFFVTVLALLGVKLGK